MGLIALLGRSASKKERTQHERSSFPFPSLSSYSSRQGHSRSPSNPNFLSAPSPIPTHPASFVEDSHALPAATLSNSPLHFKTTTDLRGRKPGDGIRSLQAVQQYHHATLGAPPSAATSFTAGPSTPIDGSDAPSTVVHINPLDDNTDPTPFAFKPYALAALDLVHPKTLKGLDTMGGLEGLCTGLCTDHTKGPSAHLLGQGAGAGENWWRRCFCRSLSDRQRVYGTNSLPTRPSKSLALKDKVLVVLSVAAVISLALVIYQDVGVVHKPEPYTDDPTRLCDPPRADFVGGIAIIIIVVLVGSLNDWQKARQFRALHEKEDRTVKVIRDGREQQVSIKDVLGGDIAHLESGGIIPCDGVLVAGHNIRCDESGAPGRSDAIKRVTPEASS